jgi:hypothetical protein
MCKVEALGPIHLSFMIRIGNRRNITITRIFIHIQYRFDYKLEPYQPYTTVLVTWLTFQDIDMSLHHDQSLPNESPSVMSRS